MTFWLGVLVGAVCAVTASAVAALLLFARQFYT